MLFSACPRCQHRFFEVREESPSGSNFKLNFVQCASCASVVGVLDYFNIGAMLEKQEAVLDGHAQALQQIDQKLNVLLTDLSRR